MKVIIILLAAILVTSGVACAALFFTGRQQYEDAAYKTLQQEGRFELRQYEALSLVASPMDDPGVKSRDRSFMRLFGYISGENETKSKIAMTVPVFVGEAGQESKAMSFVVPRQVAAEGVPAPTRKDVFRAEWSSGVYATYRFAGRPKDKKDAIALSKLTTWMEEQGLNASGEPRFAYYDPPWTPGPMRRNEVLIPVELNPES